MKEFMARLKGLFSLNGLLALTLTSLGVGYFLVGLDVINDKIPVVGYIDDVLLVLVTMYLAQMLVRKALPGLGPKGKKK